MAYGEMRRQAGETSSRLSEPARVEPVGLGNFRPGKALAIRKKLNQPLGMRKWKM
jgi:hypothetical protein